VKTEFMFPAEIWQSRIDISQSTYLALKSKERRFLLFPSYIEHSIAPNMSDKPRISIAVNFNLKKIYNVIFFF
tara:strand:+ start:1351 stop:1569 length:219 start_codon:yes stop_codon:yes gene_type:complete